jgi:predicted Rossmann fold flavoprotein
MNRAHYDVVVIGGGASGVMAAGTAAARGLRVLVLEKNNRLGVKLSISGGGRCNITNAETDIHVFLAHYGPAKDFLYSSFAQFGASDTFSFFESRGLHCVVEDRKRAFPYTHRAADVVRVLETELQKYNVDVEYGVSAQRLETQEGCITKVITDKGEFAANSYILATGGMSHPETGSTGDGFEFLRALGHTVAKPTPSIVPLSVAENYVRALSGIALPDAKVTYYCDSVKQFNKRGPIMFTHFGLSGPTILNSASKVATILSEGDVIAYIDLYPGVDTGAVEERILALFDANKNKTLKTIIGDVMTVGSAATWSVVFADLGINPELLETKVHSVSRDDRKALVKLVKALPFTIIGLMGFDRAVVADGGVVMSEIDTKTMRSKVIDNLYITGDLLHINRPSGGFSLQLCWTTGYVAGVSV